MNNERSNARWPGVTQDAQYREAWIALGRGCYVRASEVVAVLPTGASGFSARAQAEAGARHIRAVVVLRAGSVAPSYVVADTAIARLRAVEQP